MRTAHSREQKNYVSSHLVEHLEAPLVCQYFHVFGVSVHVFNVSFYPFSSIPMFILP